MQIRAICLPNELLYSRLNDLRLIVLKKEKEHQIVGPFWYRLFPREKGGEKILQ